VPEVGCRSVVAGNVHCSLATQRDLSKMVSPAISAEKTSTVGSETVRDSREFLLSRKSPTVYGKHSEM
jgi:hypothetical protein